MKKLLTLLCSTLLLAACSDTSIEEDEIPQIPPTPSGQTSINIDAADDKSIESQPEAGSLELSVASLSSWTLSIGDTRASVSWITADKTQGNASESVNLAIEENLGKEARTAYLTLKNDAATAVITVTQKAYAPANLTLSQQETEVEYNAQSISLTLSSDLKWEIESGDESFAVPSPIRGKAGEYEIKIAITENTTDKNRQTTLSARAGYETATLTITQKRKNPVEHITRGISSLDDLCRFRDAVNANADLSEWKYNGEINLLCDIDLSYIENWTPIGTNQKTGFTEIFNGNGFTISNATILYNSYATGFFGYNYGTVKNLILSHMYVVNEKETGSNYYTGGVAGYINTTENDTGGVIRNCTVSGFILGKGRTGGIVGAAYSNKPILDCTSQAIVLSTSAHEGYAIAGTWENGESNKNEGLDCRAMPYALYQTLIEESILPDGKYYSKSELLAALDTVTTVGLNIRSYYMSDPLIIEKLNLIYLYFEHNFFKSLDLSGKKMLSSLSCGKYYVDYQTGYNNYTNNTLETLNLAGCSNLSYLSLQAESLKHLDINGTAIKASDVGKYTSNNSLQYLNISDTPLERFVCELPIDTLIMNNATGKLKTLLIKGIKNEMDLSNCPVLDSLQISQCNLQNIDLSRYPALTYLNCSNNALSSLDLSKSTALKTLNCSNNNLSDLDVSKCRALKILDCNDNKLTSLDVSKCIFLECLYCGGQYNNITLDLTVYSHLFASGWTTQKNDYRNSNVIVKGELYIPDTAFKKRLAELGIITEENALKVTKLNLENTEITSLAGIEYFTRLNTLKISSTNIKDLDLSKNTALTILECNSNKLLTTLDVSNNTALTELSCYSNQLTALDLSNNTALTKLDCDINKLTSLDISNNTALTELSCYSNQLTALDLSNNTALTKLDCRGNKLTALDVSNNTALTELYCNSNQLTALDLSNNTALTTLYCYSNQLTALNVSNNTALTELSCNSNQLTALDLSNNTALTTLYCDNNKLTALDVSNNTVLTKLYCGINKLTSLDISNNTALEGLVCEYNQLTSLDLSNNTALEGLICSGNNLTSLDISKTSIGNTELPSTFYPLKCYNMDTLKKLILKTGTSIKGITSGRSTSYISAKTEIIFVD